jgi:hypothetical protein
VFPLVRELADDGFGIGLPPNVTTGAGSAHTQDIVMRARRLT